MTKNGIDWEALRLEFVNSTVTYDQLAKKYGLKPATVAKQGERNSWQDERRELSKNVVQSAQVAILQNRQKELEKIIESDLEIADTLRMLINVRLASTGDDRPNAQELHALAKTAATVQRISRLAIGASTEKHKLPGQAGVTIESAHIELTNEERAIVDQIFNAYTSRTS